MCDIAGTVDWPNPPVLLDYKKQKKKKTCPDTTILQRKHEGRERDIPRAPGDTSEANHRDTGACDHAHFTQQPRQGRGKQTTYVFSIYFSNTTQQKANRGGNKGKGKQLMTQFPVQYFSATKCTIYMYVNHKEIFFFCISV